MKLSIKNITRFLLLFFLLQITSFAQQKDEFNNNLQNKDSVFVMEKSPSTAVLKSAILPGWGQYYNESYFKIPIIWGIFGALAAGWIKNNNLYIENRDLFIQTGNERFRTLRTFYRDQRDNFSIYIGITYLLNIIDAYVDAQLFDFTIEENNIIKQPTVSVRIKF